MVAGEEVGIDVGEVGANRRKLCWLEWLGCGGKCVMQAMSSLVDVQIVGSKEWLAVTILILMGVAARFGQ
ncbi:hypothetical protein SLA2020_505950 [Shorea laevis]